MKKRIIVYAVTLAMVLFPTNVVYANMNFDIGMDNIMMDQSMQMVLDQVYMGMESSEFISDSAAYNNTIDDFLNNPMFFHDYLGDVSLDGNIGLDAFMDIGQELEFSQAIFDGDWSKDFNDFFSNSVAEIPMDIYMVGMDPTENAISIFDDFTNSNLNDIHGDALGLNAQLESPEQQLMNSLIPEENTDMIEAEQGESSNIPTQDNGSDNPSSKGIDIIKPKDDPKSDVIDNSSMNVPKD
ncbi:hypothetical protein [Alkaliphilus sp. B6464]|uniref:hypothetical protein n=1 Tax=Alkaliphilus sp. B6464 TaxID=2731219 RepID=UPI001BA9FB7D|nr:hypothetical protein [Alkaliphilus sp. B6464]QUH21970.1 hypothetical protein HYG84_18875 [Alkaliphilus sp. B6464]